MHTPHTGKTKYFATIQKKLFTIGICLFLFQATQTLAAEKDKQTKSKHHSNGAIGIDVNGGLNVFGGSSPTLEWDVGAALAYQFNFPMRLSLSYNFASVGTQFPVTGETHDIFANAYYAPRFWHFFVPYVGGGLGVIVVSGSSSFINSSSTNTASFGLRFGLGLGFEVVKNFQIGVDYHAVLDINDGQVAVHHLINASLRYFFDL